MCVDNRKPASAAPILRPATCTVFFFAVSVPPTLLLLFWQLCHYLLSFKEEDGGVLARRCLG